MSDIPGPEELLALRKSLRRRKRPKIFHEMRGGRAALGGFRVTGEGDDFLMEWNWCGSEVRACRFSDLCVDPSVAEARLELGWLIGALFDIEAKEIRGSIGHPLEALRYSAKPMKFAADWRHWALVPAGYMI